MVFFPFLLVLLLLWLLLLGRRSTVLLTCPLCMTSNPRLLPRALFFAVLGFLFFLTAMDIVMSVLAIDMNTSGPFPLPNRFRFTERTISPTSRSVLANKPRLDILATVTFPVDASCSRLTPTLSLGLCFRTTMQARPPKEDDEFEEARLEHIEGAVVAVVSDVADFKVRTDAGLPDLPDPCLMIAIFSNDDDVSPFEGMESCK